MRMSGWGRNNASHASGSNSDPSHNRFTATLQAFTDSQKAQAEQQAKANEENAELEHDLWNLGRGSNILHNQYHK